MESAGTRLKNLRLEKGSTLEDVHKKTKLHLNVLKAIEDDSLVGVNPIYMRGFLKIYCQFLGVDPKDFIPDYREPASTINLSRAGSADKPFIGKGGLSKLKFSLKKINIIIKPILLIIGLILFVLIVFNLGKAIFSKRKVVPPTARIPIVVSNKVSQKKVSDKRKNTSPVEPKKNIPAVIRLGLRAKDNSWVDLKVDGRVVFRSVLKKGKFESWVANDKIELSLGNAGAIELELDGRVIPPLGRRNQAIKGIRITKNEGLVVPR